LKNPQKLEKTVQPQLKALDKKLRNLANELFKAQQVGRESIVAFFAAEAEADSDSLAVYLEDLDEMIENLKNALCAKTSQSEKDLDKQLFEVSTELKKELADASNAKGCGTFALIRNIAENNDGSAYTNFTFVRGMNVQMEANVARRIKKDVFCNISFV